ncbi:MAG TPA: Holliday junction resolvase RuvX [Clostridiales bacterium]|nr:Holliday junction resolvase RuvX [Clostridiales bacterium]
MKIMGIDYGDARTGVSISDPTGFLAGSPQVIATWNTDELLDRLTALAAQEKVEEIVLGLPKNMNASQGERAEKCRALGAQLEARTGLPVIYWDERRTTIEAHAILHAAGKKQKKHRKSVDAVAASLILQGYLDFKRMQK